jgi:hypothetical protein
MPKESHLSIRVPQAQKMALERLAVEQDLSVGQLVRKAVQGLVGEFDQNHASTKGTKISVAPGQRIDRSAEMDWLERHIHEWMVTIPGQWVVLDGPGLVAHGHDYPAVLKDCRAKGVVVPFVARIPDSSSPGPLMGL